MQLAGRKLESSNEEIIVLPRGDGNDIILKARAVLDFSPFNKLCQAPTPPSVIRPGVGKSLNVEDPKYVAAVEAWSERRTAWMWLTSLRLGTPDLTWDTVQYEDPATWTNFIDEMKSSGFSDVEVNRVLLGCAAANSLNNERIEEARARFFHGLQQAPSTGS